MNIIFIVDNLKNNPSAIVANQFINGLNGIGDNLLVVTISAQHEDNLNNILLILIPFPFKINKTKEKILFILLFSKFYSKIINNCTLNKYLDTISNFHPDIVLTFSSCDAFSIIQLGNLISKQFSIPHHVHAVDALPAPECWGENRFLRKSKINYIRRLSADIQIFTSSNKQMLEYQLGLINNHNLLSDVIYNPINTEFICSNNKTKIITILYVGSLMSNSKGRNGIQYYKSIIHFKDISKYQFIFLGTGLDVKNTFNDIYPLPSNVHFISWTDNIDEYIKNSSLLIDIDIDADNDVFLSSKLIKYLNSDLPIISITGTNSPATNLLAVNGLGTLIISHDPELIKNSIINFDSIHIDLNTRHEYIQQFMINNIISDIMNIYASIL